MVIAKNLNPILKGRKMKTVNNKTKNKLSVNTLSTVNPLIAGLAQASNYTTTENGALTNKSSLSHVVDWFALGGALRTRTDADVINLFSKAFAEDPLRALKILFYFRDCRGGQGERKTFQTCLKWLANNHKDVVLANLENIPFFGRWDDLYCLFGTKVESNMLDLVVDQLRQDILAFKKGDSVSLLAKWLPSENTSSQETRLQGRKVREFMGITQKQYRKTLSQLRKHLNVVETQMCNNDWKSINFEKVPSKASMIYKGAFKKHQQERYVDYLSKVEKGEAKINAGTLYPYEIVRDVMRNHDSTLLKTLDMQWKNQIDYLADNPHKGIVVADVSGSMTMGTGLPILVSISLAIYFAERNLGPFKDCFLTFSNDSRLERVIGSTLEEKVSNLTRAHWGMSTNLQSCFDTVLNTAIKNKVKECDMPSVIYIITDGEFNSMSNGNLTNFEAIKQKYKISGYNMPKLVFWNVNSRNDQVPVTINDRGVCLVSGCSPSILKSVLSGKEFTPLAILDETINKIRYDRVTL